MTGEAGLVNGVSQMKVLYYCPEYYYRHGGRTHARGFFGALGKLSSVSGSFLYPKGGSRDNSQNTGKNKFPRDNLGFLPPAARNIVRFFMPRRDLTAKLINEINTHGCDAIIIRTGTRQPIIRKIKKTCPDTTICLEINSIYFDESLPGLPLRALFQRWEVRRYSQADAIVVVSSYLKTYLVERGIKPAKILVNQNGVDAEAVDRAGSNEVKEKYGIPKDAFVIGYIGGMEPFRRLPEVIAYIARLRRAGNDDIYFLIVGDGAEMPAVQAAIKVEGDVLEGAVILAGWQEHSEIPKFLETFNLAIFPFTNDYCSPLKLFEYLGAGVPTIGPDTPAVREVFEDGVHLKMVGQDGSDFVSTVLYLKANPALAKDLSDKGRWLVLNEYTWEKNAERVVSHIQSMRSQ
jgi:glycosyltransferase involved in cell wall biosynthesis